jgi:hypothetical protein
MMRHRKHPDPSTPPEPDRLARPQRPETNSRPDLAPPKAEVVDQMPTEVDGRFRPKNPDLSLDVHLVVDERRQPVDMVRMSMSQKDGPDLAGLESQLPDFGADASRTIDEIEIASAAQKTRRIIAHRGGH